MCLGPLAEGQAGARAAIAMLADEIWRTYTLLTRVEALEAASD